MRQNFTQIPHVLEPNSSKRETSRQVYYCLWFRVLDVQKLKIRNDYLTYLVKDTEFCTFVHLTQ